MHGILQYTAGQAPHKRQLPTGAAQIIKKQKKHKGNATKAALITGKTTAIIQEILTKAINNKGKTEVIKERLRQQ